MVLEVFIMKKPRGTLPTRNQQKSSRVERFWWKYGFIVLDENIGSKLFPILKYFTVSGAGTEKLMMIPSTAIHIHDQRSLPSIIVLENIQKICWKLFPILKIHVQTPCKRRSFSFHSAKNQRESVFLFVLFFFTAQHNFSTFFPNFSVFVLFSYCKTSQQKILEFYVERISCCVVSAIAPLVSSNRNIFLCFSDLFAPLLSCNFWKKNELKIWINWKSLQSEAFSRTHKRYIILKICQPRRESKFKLKWCYKKVWHNIQMRLREAEKKLENSSEQFFRILVCVFFFMCARSDPIRIFK